jgi:hypothetical protein
MACGGIGTPLVRQHAGGELLHYVDGHTMELKWRAGEVTWSPASRMHYSWDGPCKHRLENLADQPFEALIVEVKN